MRLASDVLHGTFSLHKKATKQGVLPLGGLQMTHDALSSSLNMSCQKHTGVFVLAMNAAEAHSVGPSCHGICCRSRPNVFGSVCLVALVALCRTVVLQWCGSASSD